MYGQTISGHGWGCFFCALKQHGGRFFILCSRSQLSARRRRGWGILNGHGHGWGCFFIHGKGSARRAHYQRRPRLGHPERRRRV